MKRHPRFGRFIYSSLFTGAAIATGVYLHNFLSSDPLAHYRLGKITSDQQEIAVTLNDVVFRQYQGQKMISNALIKKLEVSKDRKNLRFSNIVDGTYYTKENIFHFSAQEGTWNPDTQKLYASRDVHLYNKNLNLHSSEFEYDQPTHTLTIPNFLRGKLFEGDVEAYRLVYQTNLNSYSVGPVTWVGQLQTLAKVTEKTEKSKPKAAFQAQQAKPPATLPESSTKKTKETVQLWTIKAKSGSRPPGDIEYWHYGEATDGEIVLKADNIQRNVKTDVIIATGNLRYYSADVNALCDKTTVYRTEKRAVLEGNVQAFVKPKDQSKLEVVELEPVRPIVPSEIAEQRPPAPEKTIQNTDIDDELRSTKDKRKYPIIIWADKVEYWYQKGNRHAIITGSPTARQDFPGGRWRQVWTHTAYFDREKDLLKLVSSKDKKDTQLRTSVGDDLLARWFELSTKEGSETWQGEGIEGDVYIDEEETSP